MCVTNMDAHDCLETEKLEQEQAEEQQKMENPDLEDGEIEDDDDDDEETIKTDETPIPLNNETKLAPTQILPAAVPADFNVFTTNVNNEKDKKQRHSSERKGDKHLTEAEKCVRMLHKLEREARERRERERRREQLAGNVEKAIASVMKKDRHSASGEEEEEDDKKRGRKRKKKERERKKKHRKTEISPKTELDDDEMLNIRGASPETKKEPSSPGDNNEQGYESYDSEYDSEPYSQRPTNKRNFERDRKRDRNRNREQRRDRKNFRDKNSRKKEEQRQMQDANNICMFYMQGKCHKGDECPFSHDILPPMKLELCKFYLMDCCAKRDKCLYMHSEFPCKYYHTGLKCFAKDNCQFAHGKPLSESLKQVLLKHLETAPKEILGDFPRLSREGAQHMVNQTQKNLEIQYGISNPQTLINQSDKANIPSLFDITVSMPLELMQQNVATSTSVPATNTENTDVDKPKLQNETNSSPVKEKKVRQTRWNDEPPVPVTTNMLSMLNPTFVGNSGVQTLFPQLNLQDQQKLQEYQMNFQLKGFYSEQDQDMRISNGDVDMRTLPQIIPVKQQPSEAINFDQYRQDANLTSSTDNQTDLLSKTDVDIRNFNMVEEHHHNVVKTELNTSESSLINTDNDLTIDEKNDGNVMEVPSNLPKKQRELYLRIQSQQKENPPDREENNSTPINNDDDWYSSDDDNDPLSKMVIHLEDEEPPNKNDETPTTVLPAPAEIPSSSELLAPPLITLKPVEVIDKLGDLSKFDISDEVTKLLQTIQGSTIPASVSDAAKKSRDPRQAKLLDTDVITSPSSSDPRSSNTNSKQTSTSSASSISHQSSSSSSSSKQPERRLSSSSHRITIYEQGIINPEEKKIIYEQAEKVGIDAGGSGKVDVDLRNLGGLDVATGDLDMRQNYGDTDLRQQMIGRQDVDLRQLGLPFKAIQNYTPATEIDASIGSHSPISYKVHVVDIPRPDYTGLKLNPQDSQVSCDPRLRKIFRLPSVDEKESPASPKQSPSPPKPARQDPRRRNIQMPDETANKVVDASNLSYNQQLQLLQNSAFYQSLTSNQKLMLNQEIALKGDQNAQNDPILSGILSSLGLIQQSLTTGMGNNGASALNILNNVNSMVPPSLMGQGMPQGVLSNLGQPNVGNIGNIQMPGIAGQSMMNLNQNVGGNVALPGISPNLGPGLLGAAPGLGMPPNIPNMPPNEYSINFDPRNGGLLGQAPFQNFQDGGQNFQQYNDDFYPNNEDNCNFSGNNNFGTHRERSNNNFRGERNNRRGGGRNWNNRHNSNRNYNRNNLNRNHRDNRDRSNRSYTPP